MEGWIMADIRTSQFGSTPFGTSETRPANPVIGQTYFNGTLGVQEIYTASGWLPAAPARAPERLPPPYCRQSIWS